MKTLVQIPSRQLLHKSIACFLIFSMLFVVPAQVTLATPTNGNVVDGQAGVSQIANTTTVDVMTSNAVINWDSLDTTSAEVLQFLHDGGHFAVLNRVVQGGMTQFDGSLFGNQGTIIVVNPNGIAFGPTALVQAYQFTASALNISNEDFMNGVYQFAGGGMGDVSNYGHISAEQVALIAKKVHNSGTISSPGGFTIMASGDSVYLGSEGSNVVVEVAGVTVPDGATEGIGDVVNEGTIEAIDGKIIMAAGDTYVRAIDGLDTLTVAVASGTGTVQQRGTLIADGSEGNGGSIQLSAASEVLFADGSVTTANAGANGDGGQVIAYSPELLTFSEGALIEAKGGSESGNGGFAEVSGVEGIFFGGVADLTAANGEDGMLLIDPRNITISDAVASYHNINIGHLEHQLNHHSSVTVNTSSYSGNEAGDLTVNDDINWYSHRDLTLKAKTDLTVNDAITNTGSGDLTLEAGRHITINAPISVGDDLDLFADASGNVVGDMHSGIGATLHAGDDIDIKGNEIILGDAVSAGDDLTITGRDCIPVENDYVWGDVWVLSTLDAGGDIDISVTGEEKILIQEGYYTYKWICGQRKKVWVDTSYYDYIYHPGTIYLYDDVTAGCNLSLFNNTYTANGVTLQAGRNVNLVNDNAGPTKKDNATFLKGTKWLEIIAGAKPGVTDGEIRADNTEISVSGSTLIMEQDVTLNTNDYLFDNQENTDLTLISNNGSVISDMSKAVNAADEWASIGASAKYHVFLEGNGSIKLGDSGTDSTKSVVTQIGDIDVISGYNVDATKDIKAGDDIRISAKHGVNLQGAESGDDMTIKADVDKYWGENVTANGTLNAGGDMTLEGSNVILKDSAEAGDTMDILAHGLYSLDGKAPGSLVGSGDVLVDGSLKSGGNMTVTAIRKTGGPANGPTFDGGSAPYTATGSILIDGKADAGGTMDMNAGHDIIVKGDTLSGGNMTMNAGDDIRLKRNVNSGANIYLDADDDVELNKDAGSTVAAGNIDIHSSNTTTYLYSDVTAGGDISLHNNTWAAGGIKLDAGDDVEAYGTITGAGNLDVEADDNIRLRKNVDVAGTLNAKAGSSITLNSTSGNTTSGNAMIMDAGNDIAVYGNTTSGTAMTMDAGNDILLKRNVSAGTTMDLHAKRDIKLNENSGNTESVGIMDLTADNRDILVYGMTTSGGNMTMNAGDDIRLKKNVSSGANIDLDANDDVELNINGGNTTAVGTIDIHSGNTTTYLYSNMSAGGNITLHNNTWTQDGIKIDSDENVTIKGHVTGAGDLAIEAGSIEPGAYRDQDDITLLKSVTVAGDLDMTAGNDIFAHGKLTTTGTNGTGNMTLDAGDDMYLTATPISADSAGMMTLTAHLDPTNPGSGNVDVEGDLFANNTIEITASENTIYLAGDVKTTDGDVIFNNNVIADGSGSQSFDADGNGKKLIAKSSIKKTEPGSLTLDGGHNAGYEIELDGDVTVANGTLYVGENNSYADETTVAAGKTLQSTNGDVRIASDINGEGDLTINAGDDLRAYGDIDAAGHLAMNSGMVSGQESEMMVDGDVTAETMLLRAGTGTVDGTLRDRIKIYGDVESTVGDTEMISDDYIYVDGDVTAANDAKLIGNNDHPAGGIVGNVTVTGDVDAQNDIMAEGRNVSIYGQATAGNDVKIEATDYGFNGTDGDVYVGDGIDAGNDITVNATDDITLGTTGGVSGDAGGNIVLLADGGSYDSPYGGDVTVYGDLLADGSIEIDAADETIYLYGDTHAGDHVLLMANTKLKGKGDQWITAGSYVEADGYVRKVTKGDMWLLAEGTNEDGVSLDFRYVSDDETDPAVSAYKGNIWMIGAEDIQISGDVTTFGPDACGNTQEICSDDETGGVLIYSIDGGIYTEGDDGALTVNVTGYSDHYNGWGIYNPLLALNDNSQDGGKVQAAASEIEECFFNRVAIAIVSNDTLVLGPKGSLNAYGVYYDYDPELGGVDDRGMINFLADDGVSIPDGGPVRDEGDPFDMAIYVASTGTDSEHGQGPEGNVHIDMPVQIRSKVWVPYEDVTSEPTAARIDNVESSEEGYWTCEAKGAMVIDSYDTITFGKDFKTSLFGGKVGDRLEVVSRISEWLEDAYGRLPYAQGGGAFPAGYHYVLRGAGLENPNITDGRAWVLESRAQNGPVPLAALDIPQTKGCPVEMDAAAAELSINTDQLQLLIGNSLATNPNLQPCEACQNLLTAANTMKDIDGSRMAALAQVFNTLAPADAPFTPEVSANVATAFAGIADDDPMREQYALAEEFINAFVSYVSVLNRDLQVPVGDPAALVMEKYGETLANSDNPNIAAFVASQIEASMSGAL